MTNSAWSGKSREMRLNKGTSVADRAGRDTSHKLFREVRSAPISTARDRKNENFKNEYYKNKSVFLLKLFSIALFNRQGSVSLQDES